VRNSVNSNQVNLSGKGNPRNPGAILGIAAILLALVAFSGCNRDPNVRKHKYLESAQKYSNEGKYREAAIQYSNALKIDKNFADAHYGLSQAYVHLGSFSAAYTELMRTVDLAPNNYKARIDLADLLLAGGKTDAAQAQAAAVLAAQPNNPDVHALLSRIAHKVGQNDKALAEIRRALELDPNRPAFHEILGILQEGDPAQVSAAEGELKRSIALDPKSVNPRLLLVAFYAKNSRFPEAEQAARDAIATDPRSLAAREGLAQLFLQQGNQAKVEETLGQASRDLKDNPQAVSVLADYYSTSGQDDKAKGEFARLASEFPKNLSVQEGYVRALLQVKDLATAQTVVAGLMKSNGKDPKIAALNGIVMLNNGKAGDAVNALQSAAKDFPKDAFIQLWLGKAALASGDPSLAEKSFHQATALNPGTLEAQQELARIASQRGDMNLMGEVAEKTIAAAPRFPGGYVWRATVEWNHNDPARAEADLKTAISVAPQSPQAYLKLGQLRFAEKLFPEGAALLEQALQFDPNSVDALRGLVGYDLYVKQPDHALARLNAQIAKEPKNSNFYDLLAQYQVQNKNLDQASAAAQKAMQINPDDGEAVAIFAQLQLQRGQTPNAVAAWEQYSRSHPNNAGALAILGTLEESRGDNGKAEAYYRKALQIQPHQPIASNNLAYRMLQNGENVDVALSLAQTARQAMPNSPTTADTLAWAYYYKGTYAFARDLLEEAVKTDPSSPAMQYHLGMVYSKLRDKNNASMHLKKAMSLAPDSPAGKDAQTALKGLG
jgi:tetratricopeptide (TPR) repeat protein